MDTLISGCLLLEAAVGAAGSSDDPPDVAGAAEAAEAGEADASGGEAAQGAAEAARRDASGACRGVGLDESHTFARSSGLRGRGGEHAQGVILDLPSHPRLGTIKSHYALEDCDESSPAGGHGARRRCCQDRRSGACAGARRLAGQRELDGSHKGDALQSARSVSRRQTSNTPCPSPPECPKARREKPSQAGADGTDADSVHADVPEAAGGSDKPVLQEESSATAPLHCGSLCFWGSACPGRWLQASFSRRMPDLMSYPVSLYRPLKTSAESRLMRPEQAHPFAIRSPRRRPWTLWIGTPASAPSGRTAVPFATFATFLAGCLFALSACLPACPLAL